MGWQRQGMAVHGCVCAGEPRTEPGHSPPFLLFHMAFISPVTLEWYFFLILLIFISSPDENVPGFKQCLLSCGRQRGGVRFISISSPPELCPGHPPASCYFLRS